MFIIRKCAGVFGHDICVDILTITTRRCWTSELMPSSKDLIVGSTSKKDEKSSATADEEQSARPEWNLLYFFSFCSSLLLIIHKGDHPLSEPLPLFLQGQKRVASCSLWQRFLRCGQSCLETTSSPFTCHWSYSSPEEGQRCMGKTAKPISLFWSPGIFGNCSTVCKNRLKLCCPPGVQRTTHVLCNCPTFVIDYLHFVSLYDLVDTRMMLTIKLPHQDIC